MNFCIMASKLAYENAKVVKNIIVHHWKEVDEEPNKNYFGVLYLIPEYINAIWELMRSLTMEYTYGKDYKEGWCRVVLRVAIPGISALSYRLCQLSKTWKKTTCPYIMSAIIQILDQTRFFIYSRVEQHK